MEKRVKGYDRLSKVDGYVLNKDREAFLAAKKRHEQQRKISETIEKVSEIDDRLSILEQNSNQILDILKKLQGGV